MHSATETIWGRTSCRTLIIARSLRLSALGSVMNAKSSSVNFSSSARKRETLDICCSFHTTQIDSIIITVFSTGHLTSPDIIVITIPCNSPPCQASEQGGELQDATPVIMCHSGRSEEICHDYSWARCVPGPSPRKRASWANRV